MSKWTLLKVLDKCNNVRCFKQLHAQLVASGIVQDGLVLSKIVSFFGSYVDNVDYACNFLNQIRYNLSSFPYNTLISGYASSDKPQAAIFVYRQVIRDGFLPDMFTFPVVLKACVKFFGIGEAKQVHGVITKMGFCCDLYVQNSLLHLYSVCGECSDAIKVFGGMLKRDVVSWTGLISGYVRAGLFGEALALFLRMDVEPNVATLVSVLVACGRLRDRDLGKRIHGLICKLNLEVDLVVGNALMDMYVKCECFYEAEKLFDELPERDIVSWTSIISGLVQCKYPREALELFYAMQIAQVEPDRVILTSVLSACASLGALDCGRWVHQYIDRSGIEWDTHVGTAMVDMYAKCGCIDMALITFREMSHRNVFTWNALIGGLAMHGHGEEALKHFEQMVRTGMRPNEVTFLAILTACCHSGLVDEGRSYFYLMMSQDYNVTPRLEHYGCMVDLFGRAGLLDEAQELIKTMPMPPDVLIWGALLSACKANGRVELCQKIFDHLLELESHDSGVYVLLSNIYARNERWKNATRVRNLMKEKGVRKAPGSSVIEVDGKAHELVGDVEHLQKEEIYLVLNTLSNDICLEGMP